MTAPPLTDLESQFDRLQQKLTPMWRFIGSGVGGPDQEENAVVVVPAMNVDVEMPASIQQAYEERFLFMLLLLRQPGIRMIYVTSLAIQPDILDYYLHLLPGVTISNARKRLAVVAPLDGSPRSLSEKLLDRPHLLAEMRKLIGDPERAHLVPFNTTELERELAVRLGIPMYAADPRFYGLGTKSGSRRIFAEEGVPHPLGSEDLSGPWDIVRAIVRMRAQRPAMSAAIVKLNEGVSGMGNALVDLEGLPAPGSPEEETAIEHRLRSMEFALETGTYDSYVAKLQEHGGIVEEMILGDELHSPSAQLRITPLGEVELLSTHDQMLGGPSGQLYLGASFPANPEYGPLIMREAAKVGRRFAREGIVGRFALDFVVFRKPSRDWDAYAIEINLRKGGTTHPFLTLQYLTDGRYDAETGHFATAQGTRKCYVASDHVESDRYRVFRPDDLFDIVSRRHLHFDHARQTGIVLHMLPSVSEAGRFGLTAVANTPEEANELYRRSLDVFDEEAQA